MGWSNMGWLGANQACPLCNPTDSPAQLPPQLPPTWDAQFRPFPNPSTGELFAEAHVRFQAQKFPLQFDFVYGSKQTENNEPGQGWLSYIRARIYSPTSGNTVTISRGAFVDRLYTRQGFGPLPFNYTSSVLGATTTLQYDGTKFTE